MDASVSALLLDISGVLYDGSTPIDGAAATLQYARKQGLTIRFVTNTASKSTAAIVQDLAQMGIVLTEDELYTAPLAARDYILAKGLRPLILLHRNILPLFADLEQQQPNAVVLGDAREQLSYENLNRVFQLCKQGAPLIAVGMNKYFSENGQLQMDAGPFVRAVEWAADCQAVVMGKPDATFFRQVAASTGVAPEQCLMVGDDVQADVLGAVAVGMQGCLVKTGKYGPGDEQQLPRQAHLIDSIADLPTLLRPELKRSLA